MTITAKQLEYINDLWGKLDKLGENTPVETQIGLMAHFSELTKEQASKLIPILQQAIRVEDVLNRIVETPDVFLLGRHAGLWLQALVEVAAEQELHDDAEMIELVSRRKAANALKKLMAKKN